MTHMNISRGRGSTWLGEGIAARWQLGALLLLSGCYAHAYHLRGPAPDLQRVAIENKPHETTQWSTFWGASGVEEWSPVECLARDAAGSCTQQVSYCDKGLGRVEVSYTAATFVLTVLTLGIAVPMHVSAWCATDSGPHHGP